MSLFSTKMSDHLVTRGTMSDHLVIRVLFSTKMSDHLVARGSVSKLRPM